MESNQETPFFQRVAQWTRKGAPLTDRAMRFLSYEVRGLHAAFYVLAFSAFFSSLLALLRDRLLAHYFGAGTVLDLYYAAFRIPDLIFVGMAALVSVYILIPALAKRDDAAQKDYIDTVVAGFSLLAVVLSVVAFFLAPFFLAVLFPEIMGRGYASELVNLTRIMLLQPFLLGLSNILGAITQSKMRYALYSLSPLLYNLGIILGVVVFYQLWGISGLALGVVLGALMHCAIQIPSAIRDGFFRRIPRIREPRALIETALISIPRALALSMNQIAFMCLTALAGLLASGSIAVFMFAYNLQAVPLAVIGASYSVAAFPTLAAALSRGERGLFISHIATAARYVFFWSLPATALVIVLRAYLVRVVLGSGAFDWTDTRLTAAALALLGISLSAQGLQLLLVRGYYAAGRTFVPFMVALASALATMLLGAISVGAFRLSPISDFIQAFLRVVDVPGSNVLALALSYSIVSIISTIVLIVHFEHRFGGFFAQVRRAWAESALAALVGGLGAYAFLWLIGPITFASTTFSALTHGFAGGVFGIIVTGLTYWVLSSKELGEIADSVRARLLWGQKISAPGIAVVASAEEQPTSTQ